MVTINYWDRSVIEFGKESCDAVIVNVNIKVSSHDAVCHGDAVLYTIV